MTTSSGPFTRTDLERLADDGRKQEVIDGVLIVTPVPGLVHQRAVANLAMVLDEACPPEFEVLPGPFAVGLAEDTELRPDVVVALRDRFTDVDLPEAPALAVEVLSPCTRSLDMVVKRERLERAGAPSFWVVDPEGARIVAWELTGGRYQQVADVAGGDKFTADLPYPVSVIPADLVR
jgi:Uma2 family endonuclease